MRNHHNHESSPEIKFQASWLRTKDKDLHLIRCHFRQIIPLWLTTSKLFHSFVPISLRVASRPNLSPAYESQPDHSDLWAGKGEALGPPSPAERMHTNLPCQQSWKRELAHQFPSTLSEKTLVIICDQSRFRVQRVKLWRTGFYWVLCSRSYSSSSRIFPD